jgi:hypothetical protein
LPGHLDRVEVGAHAGHDVDIAGARVLLLLGGGRGLEVPGLRGEAIADAGELGYERDEVAGARARARAPVKEAALSAAAAAGLLVGLLGVLQGDVDLVDFRLGKMIRRLTAASLAQAVGR